MGLVATTAPSPIPEHRNGRRLSNIALAVEFVALFLLIPLGYRASPVRFPPLPLLWAATLYCYLILRRDPGWHPKCLWHGSAVRGQLVQVFSLFAVCAVVIVAGIWRFTPRLFFILVRTRPALWALVMIFYPLLSVYPQSLVFRAFLMHRYESFFAGAAPEKRKWLLVALSAAAFSFMHIIFRNWTAVWMTLIGGVFFAWRYYRKRSLALSMLEHSLYGCLLFTAGLGDSFYIGPHPLH